MDKRKTHGHTTRVGKVGQYRSKTYITWLSMKLRCLNPNHKSYKDYNGRGISICDRWLGRSGFSNFILDMGERPLGLTLDRKDLTLGYNPQNCRWATSSQQAQNKTTSKIVEYMGFKMCISEWAKYAEISEQNLRYRIKAGWKIEEALGYV